MIMFTCTYSLLFYFKEKYYNTMKKVEGWELNQKKTTLYMFLQLQIVNIIIVKQGGEGRTLRS